MKKEGLEIFILAGCIEDGEMKNRITYLVKLGKWLAEQCLGGITKRKKIIKRYKGEEIMENYDL